jgi:hypothetical protein
MSTIDKKTTLEKEVVFDTFLEKRKVKLIPISKKNPFGNFDLLEFDPQTGKHEKKSNIPDQFNNIERSVDVPLSRQSGVVKRILDNTIKKNIQGYDSPITEQEFFEHELGFEKGGLDLSKMYTDDKGKQTKRTVWSTRPCKVIIRNEAMFLDLNTPKGMFEYKILMANTGSVIAPSIERQNELPSYSHVLVDVDYEHVKGVEAFKKKQEAFQKFTEITSGKDISKLNDLYSLYTNKLQSSSKYEFVYKELGDLVENKSEEFLALLADPLFDEKILLLKAVAKGEIKKKPSGEYHLIDGRNLGLYSSTLQYLRADENFAIVETLKQRLKL